MNHIGIILACIEATINDNVDITSISTQISIPIHKY